MTETSDQPAFPPLGDDEWPDEIADLRPGFAGRLNVYRVMAHNPALLRAWQDFREHVVVRNALGRQRSEVVILRTGYRLASPYEWAHHVVRARGCGMDDARIASLRRTPGEMAAQDAVIAAAVDELVDGARLRGATRAALAALVGTAGVFDVLATVGHYSTLAFIANSFGTPLDDEIAAELAHRPLEEG